MLYPEDPNSKMLQLSSPWPQMVSISIPTQDGPGELIILFESEAMHEGQIITMPNFTLFDAMNAIEVSTVYVLSRPDINTRMTDHGPPDGQRRDARRR